MEIHHQHHHDHPQHKEKLWVHYALEFFMLFLAVSAGFFTENLREKISDNQREREYIVSFVEDLKEDTARINYNIKWREDNEQRMDSLTSLLSSPDYSEHTAQIYYYARWTLRNHYFVNSDRTIQQLKNAGGMRIISDKKAADAIMYYDAQVKTVNPQMYDIERSQGDRFEDWAMKILDGNILDRMYGDSLIKMPEGNPPLLTNDRQVLNGIVTELHFVKSVNKRSIYFEKKLKAQAVSTIEFFQKEYHLQ